MSKRKIKNNQSLLNNKEVEILKANNIALSRQLFSNLVNKSHGGKRNLYSVFGYDLNVTSNQMRSRYERQDISKRVVDAYPNACWSMWPSITDDLNNDTESQFELSFNELSKKTKLFSYISRVDKLANMGRYSVLYIGVNDGARPSEPLDNANLDIDDILFYAPYSECNAVIDEFEADPISPRFGLPKFYTLNTNSVSSKNRSGDSSTNFRVHHSRVIHIAENLLEDDIYGVPTLLPIINRLIDLEKVVGGASEMFWQNGRGAFNVNIDKDSCDLTVDQQAKLKDDVESFTNELTRTMVTKGYDLNSIQFQVPDPTNTFDVLIQLISSSTGIPKRILIGSEQGQLASSQDENNWNKRISDRRNNFCENTILRPIIDWFIRYGVLPSVESYDVLWDELTGLSELDKADIAMKKSSAMKSYSDAQGAHMLVPEKQFVEEILGLDFKGEDSPNDLNPDEMPEAIENG